ncbi:helix-turn-helix domain-containing protein [Pandoraea fibrosis]|uniref:Helix-turn-helix domain-containing protein n=1 Tax=Pandoraea fibrosis TaxID=1891094 RepID=A0ABX6HQW2_9BURK|nr:XRE family transcriptional regulator [Pandoraea fibrosis]QHE93539.1 helix-turn-helix domain-containing protein [Pandoraea fibrosis]QHF12899.1 helix-turn-helix domain-containing protein [Pandoraea fibrosis]
MDINERIARRVRDLRSERGYSLDTLAERSGVSRSSISLIERAQTSPTANVLDKLATALDVTLASLFDTHTPEDAPPSPLARHADQPVWTDPDSGYVRRNLSPAQPSPLQFVEVQFPAGERVAYDTGARDNEVWQQIWMIDGTIEITLGDATWRLDTGDCLAMRLDQPIGFHNPTSVSAHYLVGLVTLPFVAPRRSQ